MLKQREAAAEGQRTRAAILTEAARLATVGMFGIAVEAGDEEEQLEGTPASEAAPAPPAVPIATPIPPLAPDVPAAPPGATMVYAADPTPEPVPEPAKAPAEVAVLVWDGRERNLDGPTVVIGRSSDCDIVVGDPNVSRRHAEVRRVGRGFSLVDLGSTNGTEVNGQRRRQQQAGASGPLGDVRVRGRTELRQQVAAGAAVLRFVSQEQAQLRVAEPVVVLGRVEPPAPPSRRQHASAPRPVSAAARRRRCLALVALLGEQSRGLPEFVSGFCRDGPCFRGRWPR